MPPAIKRTMNTRVNNLKIKLVGILPVLLKDINSNEISILFKFQIDIKRRYISI